MGFGLGPPTGKEKRHPVGVPLSWGDEASSAGQAAGGGCGASAAASAGAASATGAAGSGAAGSGVDAISAGVTADASTGAAGAVSVGWTAGFSALSPCGLPPELGCFRSGRTAAGRGAGFLAVSSRPLANSIT